MVSVGSLVAEISLYLGRATPICSSSGVFSSRLYFNNIPSELREITAVRYSTNYLWNMLFWWKWKPITLEINGREQTVYVNVNSLVKRMGIAGSDEFSQDGRENIQKVVKVVRNLAVELATTSSEERSQILSGALRAERCFRAIVNEVLYTYAERDKISLPLPIYIQGELARGVFSTCSKAILLEPSRPPKRIVFGVIHPNSKGITCPPIIPDIARSLRVIDPERRHFLYPDILSNATREVCFSAPLGIPILKDSTTRDVVRFTSFMRQHFSLGAEVVSMQAAADLIQGLVLLHHRQIFHRDIKPYNVVVHPDERGHLHFKYIDFGFTKQQGDCSGYAGTPNYYSPEYREAVALHKASSRFRSSPKQNFSRLEEKKEVWSLGKTLWEFSDKGAISTTADSYKSKEHIFGFTGVNPNDVTNFEMLLKWMLQVDPAMRPTAAQVLAKFTVLPDVPRHIIDQII